MSKKLPKGYTYNPNNQLLCLRFTYRGNRKAVYGHTYKECEAKKAELIDSLKNHMHIDNQKITLDRFYSTWETEQAKTVKPQTIDHNRKSWVYISRYLGKLKIVDINKNDVLQLQNDVLQISTADNANRVVKLLKQILNGAVNDRIINFNPCTGIRPLKKEKPKAVTTNHRALTEQETSLFLRKAESSQYHSLFLFLVNTGCRVGEATALTWFDVNFEKKEIGINKTTARVGNRWVVSDSPKTESSNRRIPMRKEIEDLLRKQYEQNQALFGSRCIYVFPNSRGGMANYNGINNCIHSITKQISKESGFIFPAFSVHALRDTFATRVIENGMNPHTLKDILGHKSLKMTMDLYAQVMPNTKLQELEKIKAIV